MAIQTYEGLFLLDPNKASSDWEGSSQSVVGTIQRYGGEIIFTRPWGDYKLAYPIQKFRKGVYLLVYFKAESERLYEMHADFRISEVVMRRMIIKLHPKIAADMLAHYTDDQQGGEGVEAPVEEAVPAGVTA